MRSKVINISNYTNNNADQISRSEICTRSGQCLPFDKEKKSLVAAVQALVEQPLAASGDKLSASLVFLSEGNTDNLVLVM